MISATVKLIVLVTISVLLIGSFLHGSAQTNSQKNNFEDSQTQTSLHQSIKINFPHIKGQKTMLTWKKADLPRFIGKRCITKVIENGELTLPNNTVIKFEKMNVTTETIGKRTFVTLESLE